MRKQVEALESRARGSSRSADAFDRWLEAQRAQVERNPRERMIATVKSRLPLALGILAGILLLPALIKTILYFGVAPLAGRLAPVRILPSADAPPFPRPPRSEVSAALEIAPGDELLVQPDFLQSSSQPAIKRTRWFLNPRLPFASLASGMFALTSVRPEGATTTRAVVSSQRDPFSEIGVIDIPAGAAMVIQPRSLAAVVKPAGQPTHITRHWRLGSLHAWITLQLRYLVFHGPCRLLLKGCRGVRAEAPLPGQPRLINQAANARLQRQPRLPHDPLRDLRALPARPGRALQRPLRRRAGVVHLRGNAGAGSARRLDRPRAGGRLRRLPMGAF